MRNTWYFVPGARICTDHPPTSRHAHHQINPRVCLLQAFSLTTPPCQEAAAEALVRSMAPGARLTYSLAGTRKYELPREEVSLAGGFSGRDEGEWRRVEMRDVRVDRRFVARDAVPGTQSPWGEGRVAKYVAATCHAVIHPGHPLTPPQVCLRPWMRRSRRARCACWTGPCTPPPWRMFSCSWRGLLVRRPASNGWPAPGLLGGRGGPSPLCVAEC